MIKGDLKNIEPNHYEREPTWSTSSCYNRISTQRPQSIKLNKIQQMQDFQDKDFTQRLQFIQTEFNVRVEQFKKKLGETQKERKELVNSMNEVESSSNNQLKKIHKQDRTKQWSTEMQSTIKQIMKDKAQMEEKNYAKANKQVSVNYEKVIELEESVRGEKKQRESFWENIIDQLGEQIMNLESIIENEKMESEEKMLEFESQIIEMQEQTGLLLLNQTKKREEEHNYLTRLIENVMNKLII